jgi:CRP-like cAMP-binding protein
VTDIRSPSLEPHEHPGQPHEYSVGSFPVAIAKGSETMDPDRLKTIPLFSSLSEKALETVSVFSSETSVSAGKRLVHEGDYSYDLIVIEAGTADVLKAGEVIGTLGPGDVFGEIGMLTGGKRTADVVATSAMRLITLSKWDLKRISTEIGDQLKALVEERQSHDSDNTRVS